MNEENQLSNEAKITVHLLSNPSENSSAVIKVEVDLLGLPEASYGGHEVVVEYRIFNFENEKTFYTDSNGLDMQKRVLNYRPTWDIQMNYNVSNDNITANFYPINSAI